MQQGTNYEIVAAERIQKNQMSNKMRKKIERIEKGETRRQGKLQSRYDRIKVSEGKKVWQARNFLASTASNRPRQFNGSSMPV